LFLARRFNLAAAAAAGRSKNKQEDLQAFFQENIFVLESMKINEPHAVCRLKDATNLAEDCLQTKVSELAGEKFNIGNEQSSTKFQR